ncbi:TRAF family member-associated NF-kappa-B activator isoform X2 [Trichomycterus rosablanca]|uniref:TRAF family member-associated NF-kappa-B activator isoform X2 n=1 Tax=Trichomycterus rosablanca TaxID=2290929 RepID=UPI002F35DB49
MDRNRDQLNKAYEAYRNASIEKDNAKEELKQKTEQFERYTEQLERKIEDQQQLISELKAQLISIKLASEEPKCCEAAHRKQETERLSPSSQWPGNPSTSHRTNHILSVKKESAAFTQTLFHQSPGHSGTENVLDTLQEIQGTFQRIQTLARQQKDHLKRIPRGNDATNEQFSMPIQCTDDTAQQAEVPFPASSQAKVKDGLISGALASRGVSPEDTSFMDGVKFPPPTDSEYEFLHSTPDRPVQTMFRKCLAAPTSTVPEESCSSYSDSLPPSHLLPSSASNESVRGPQQGFGHPLRHSQS